jgi:integrase
LFAAVGEHPAYMMDQLGHTDPKLSLRVYTQVMKRRDRDELKEKVTRLMDGAIESRRQETVVTSRG